MQCVGKGKEKEKERERGDTGERRKERGERREEGRRGSKEETPTKEVQTFLGEAALCTYSMRSCCEAVDSLF